MSVIVDSYSESNFYRSYWTLFDNIDDHSHKVGQSITGNGGILDSAIFYLRKVGSPTGNAYAKIYAHDGTFGTSSIPTGTALATSDEYGVSNLTTSYQLITFTFSGANKITLTDETKYVVTIEYDNGTYLVDYIRVGLDETSPTHGGNLSGYSTEEGWLPSGSWDLCFYVYRDETIWTEKTKSSLDWSLVSRPTINWTEDEKSITDWTEDEKSTTEWTEG